MKSLLAVVGAFALMACSSVLFAQDSGSKYDWRSGNSYHWNTTPEGSTQVHGFNVQNGTQWNTTIQPNGNMRGTDGNFNTWNYNAQSGYYHNNGTGETCVGKGYGRTCF
jgi:hypothetical protein